MVRYLLEITQNTEVSFVSCAIRAKKFFRGVRGHAPLENLLNAPSSPPFFFFTQALLTHRLILPILTGAEETRKLVAHEHIEHWPNVRTVPRREKCSCRRVSVRLH